MTTNDAVRAALSWLATYGLHSTLFLGGAWILCALRPPRVNRNRERLWKLALVGGLVSATLQVATGARPLLGRIAWQETAPAREAAPVAPLSARGPELAHEPLEQANLPPQRIRGTEPADMARGRTRLVESRRPAPLANEARAPASSSLPKLPKLPRIPSASAEASELVLTRTDSVAAPGDTSERLLQPISSRAAGFLAHLASPSWAGRWPGLVLGLWFACGLLGVAGLLFSWTCLRRRMLGRRILVDGALVELLESLRTRAGVARRVRLSVSPRIAAPFSTGLFRPEVCVPTAVLTALNRAQQEALLAHELAHLVRRDPAWFGLGFLLEKLFFFQPLNRLARRRISELAEIACDDWAVRWTGARVALASCLAEVAGWIVGERPRLAMPPGLAGQPSRLAQRVERLLDDRRSPAGEPPASWWPPLAAATLTLAALAVPGVSAEGARKARVPASEPSPGGPPATPSAAPAATYSAPRAAPTVPARMDLSAERGVLEAELVLLEAELSALHAELEARALRTRFQDALLDIDARMDELRSQHQRAHELLTLLATPNTPASAPEPPADALPPSTNPGESR